ncbi:16S rRNA (uracil(1498)-N(3))-methyltransferase [Aliidiomarina celeris]|uniref:16S rRNA (uracil(1498)-N(3))-methyltransferase n=1 Tax=Aliidiomarina celeris TaxID=2249428 RepID=UPI000DE8D45E|nr:16S rRNA (uracil(1498)-N(3))-methyltransferase [Aliidiomarina celeris]
MREPRIYHPEPLQSNTEVALSEDAANHVGRVLRLREGASLQLFCGDNCVYPAVIVAASKKNVTVKLGEQQQQNRESPLELHLAQGISRGERMDFVLQKSVELGVHSITPLFTERCSVKLQGERLAKKREQWQRMVISACEQSGRNVVPVVHEPIALTEWLSQPAEGIRVMLEPTAQHAIRELPTAACFELLIGPEGGFSAAEVENCVQQGCHTVRLGPRVLRTETAALSALTALQCHFGDLA